MNTELIAIAREVAAPMVEKILARRIGVENAQLARDLVEAIARRAGFDSATPDFQEAIRQGDTRVVDAVATAEIHVVPELVELYAGELEVKAHRFEREERGPFWTWAWRPAGMWALGFMWLWNVTILHVANAVWKIALPPMDLSILLQLSALYMSLYMGGHTVKAVMSGRAAA